MLIDKDLMITVDLLYFQAVQEIEAEWYEHLHVRSKVSLSLYFAKSYKLGEENQ